MPPTKENREELPPLVWPLFDQPPLFPDAPGKFAAIREHNVHTGVDLYANPNQAVVAMEDGVVVAVEPFTGAHVPGDDCSPWWKDTWAIFVEGASGVIVYGEVRPLVDVGKRVRTNEHIGFVLPVLRTFKGRPMVMLHLELLRRETRSTSWWLPCTPQPETVLDPAALLRAAAGPPTPRVFDLDFYDGVRFRDPSAEVKIVYDFGVRLRRP